jgi:hypothetical protein
MRLAAIVFTLLSSAALADPSHRATAVPMSEAELDEITAGAVTTLSIILTPGNGGSPDFLIKDPNPSGSNHLQCHNCTLFGGPLEQGPAQGARLMINNGHPEGKIRCFGGLTFLGC